MNRRQILASCCALVGAGASTGAKGRSQTTVKPLLSKNSTRSEAAELAGSLLESLDVAHDDPAAVEAAWNEEIARRIEELDSGKVETVPWEEVRRRISTQKQVRRLFAPMVRAGRVKTDE
jgi:putative addiction module component (TIGR02574 family)